MKIKDFEKNIKIFEFVNRFELEPIVVEVGEGATFEFVIDIYMDAGRNGPFFPRVYRKESVRLRPSFAADEEFDEEVLVRDLSQSWEDIRMNKVSEVLSIVIGHISKMFGDAGNQGG